MKKLFLLIFLLASSYSEAILEKSYFMKEWRRFVHQKQLDLTKIGTHAYLQTEFAYLEEFGQMQLHRRRPYIEEIDHDSKWTPFLENKVTLSDGSEMSASIIRFTTSQQPHYHNFIASQAPKNLNLFWQMVWENQLEQIVMVTELSEPNKNLCPLYFPEKAGEKILLENGLQITLKRIESLLSHMKESIQVRTLQISYKGNTRIVTHYWYRNWLDRTAPNQMTTLFTLIGTVKREKSNSTIPILVHCHGGVGRTGTFIALYHMIQRMELNDTPISLFECIGHMRWQRPKLVSNPLQYQFCYGFLKRLQPR